MRKMRAGAARTTFLSVARCENVKRCLETNEAHPCREIVEYQVRERGVKGYADFQLPEPWVGQIDSARILFVSSNPSIGDDNHALGASSYEALWVGKAARERIQGAGCGSSPQIEEREIGGLSRTIAYLPHPASFTAGPRTLAGLYPDQLSQLQIAANQ